MCERLLALFLGRGRSERRAIQEGAEEVDRARRAGVRGPAARVAREVDRCGRRAVVRPVRREHLRSSAVHASHAHRVLDGLRPARGEEHVPEPVRGDLDDHSRRFAADVGCMGRRERAQLIGLLLDRGDDARMLVTEVGEDQLRAEVQVAPAVGIDDMATAANEGQHVARPLHRPRMKTSSSRSTASVRSWAPALDERERRAPSVRFPQLALGLRA